MNEDKELWRDIDEFVSEPFMTSPFITSSLRSSETYYNSNSIVKKMMNVEKELRRDIEKLFSEPFMPSSFITPSLLTSDTCHNSILRRSSPHYEITENDGQYQIAITLPGVKISDMTVRLERGGRILTIQGGRKVHKGHEVSETTFESR